MKPSLSMDNPGFGILVVIGALWTFIITLLWLRIVAGEPCALTSD
jgi:hypothetical protein